MKQALRMSTNEVQLFSLTPKGFRKKKVKEVLRFNIKVLHKLISILKKPKDKISEKASKEDIYTIKSKECPSVYIGQSTHVLKSCVKEHAKVLATELDKT